MRIRPARATDAGVAAGLLLQTDPALFGHVFDAGALRGEPVLAACWSAAAGDIFSHRHARIAESGEGLPVGLIVSQQGAGHEADWLPTLDQLLAAVPAAALPAFRRAIDDAIGLVPEIPEDCLFVEALSVAAGWRCRGIGSALLAGALEDARQAGLDACHLDMAEDNPALGFYQRHGFAVARRTDIPALTAAGVAPHLRLVRPLHR